MIAITEKKQINFIGEALRLLKVQVFDIIKKETESKQLLHFTCYFDICGDDTFRPP